MILLIALAAEPTKAPLENSTISAIVVSSIAAILSGAFAIWVKKARTPADRLAQQVALEEAQAKRAREERERDAAKEQGYREAAEFIKKSAETAIATYKDQTSELRETIAVLTNSLETHQRIASAERQLSDDERNANNATVTKLRDRIAALEDQIENLLTLTRAQQLKIDVLEGRAPAESEPLDGTIPREQLRNLTHAMTTGPSAVL
jgi:chromosome segregation ATPase